MKYDLGIVGGGPGGYSAAFEAAKNGLNVVLFEMDKLGGTCLNRGCIPTKYLAHIANIRSDLAVAQEMGFVAKNDLVNFKAIQAKKNLVVDSLYSNLRESLTRAKIKVVNGAASVNTAGSILCGSDEYRVDKIIIATGAIVGLPLTDGFLNSDGVLKMGDLPETVKIVGGGTVAVEFAQIFRRLGAEVRIQIRGDRLLKNWNREVSSSVTRLLKEEGVQIETKCETERLKEKDALLCISAMGMQPSLSGLNTDLFDIGESGGIIVDGYGETKTKDIYAVGDVVEGSSQLAHHAMEEGRRTVRHIVGLEVPPRACRIRCIYLHPEIAEAGITEEQARADSLSTVSAKVLLYSNSMNMIYGGKRGYIKLLADKEKGILIGAQVMGERASDFISELALTINAGIPVRECIESVRPHPSFSEGISDAFYALREKLG